MSGIKPGSKRFIRRGYKPFLLLLPSFALIAVFKVYPIFYSVIGSFLMRGARGVIKFAGLKNFKMIFTDPSILNSIWVTIKFNLITVPLQIVLALIFALMLNRRIRFVQTARTLLYIPVAINMIIASTIWNMMLNPSSGPANAILGALGIPPQPFLTSSRQALWVIIIICCWKGVSYWMLFLLAGLQNINSSIYEAGRIDGTTFFSELFSLTIPMLKNSLVFVIVSDTMINLFMFIPAYLLTGGGPEGSTDTLMYEAYRAAFKFSNYNRSYAIVTVLMLMTFIVIGLQFYFFRDSRGSGFKRRFLRRGMEK